jgi:hypothetical protein
MSHMPFASEGRNGFLIHVPKAVAFDDLPGNFSRTLR